MNAGDFTLESTFDIKFTTIDSTGLGSALTSGVVSAYPGNSLTQLTAGITLSANFDSLTGLNNVRVVATAANGYADATDYVLVLTAGTVDSISVIGYVIAHFSIGKRSTAAIKTDTAAILVDTGTTLQAELDAIQAAVITNAAGVDIAADIIALKAVADAVLVDTGTTLDAALAIVDGNVDSILVDTAEIGAAGAGLTAVALADATSDAVIADAVWNAATATYGAAGSYGLLVETDLDAAISSRLATAGYTAPDNTSIAAILVDTGTTLDGLITTVDTVVDAIKVQTDKLTFTVANQVDANTQYINDTALTGDGAATPWGPA
jgi:hypothetical protein